MSFSLLFVVSILDTYPYSSPTCVISFSQAIRDNDFRMNFHKSKNKGEEKIEISSCVTDYNTIKTEDEELIEMPKFSEKVFRKISS